MHAPVAEIMRLIHHAAEHLEKARADNDGTAAALRRVRAAERLLLLVRVAADTGARRGELASHLAHCFARLRTSAGVPEVTLHRLRHSVATFLVDRGDILKAQLRLGHRDASTTLRYAHALPLEDLEVADALDALLSPVANGRDT